MIKSFTLACLLFLLPVCSLQAASFTSVTTGAWNDPFTWDPLGASGTPGSADNVTIAATHTVSLTQTEAAHDLTIAANAILYHGGYLLNLHGSYICNGSHNSGGTMDFLGGPNETFQVPASGSFNFSGTMNIYGTKTITAATDIQYISASLTIATGDTIINNGYVWIRGTVTGADASAWWIQGANARVYAHNTFMSTGSLDASATGNICYFWADIKNFFVYGAATNYNNVFLRCNNPRTLTLQANMDINGFCYQNSSSNKVFTNGATISVAGNYRSFNAQFPTGEGDVNMDGAAAQQIRNETSMTEIRFDELTVSGANVVTNLPLVTNTALTVSGSLDLSANFYQLTINGDFTNTGTLNTRSSKVLVNGNNVQTFAGTSTTTFRDLEVDKSGGTATIASGTFNIDSVMTMTAGTFNPNGNMVILSNASRTARLAPVAGGSITGSVTMQRYISTRNAEFQNFAAPGNSTILDWDNEIFMSGVGGTDGNASGNGGIFYSVKKYNETTNSYTDVTSTGETLDAGKGFHVFLGDDLNTYNASTIDTRGIPYQGDQALPLTFTASNGWNLVGNPFASWISWDSIYNSTTDIDNNFYVLNAATGSYTTYGASDEIPATQGFWVHCTAGTTLNINENSKVENTTSTFYRMPNAYKEALRFTISSKLNPFSHTSVVRFDTQAEDRYEQADALFRSVLDTRVPSITTFSNDGRELNINAQSIMSRELSIPMKATVGVTGKYFIDVEGLEFAEHFTCIALEDKATGEIYDLREQQRIMVSLSAEENTQRFVLHLAVEGYGLCSKDGTLELPAENEVIATQQNDAVFLGLHFNKEEEVQISMYNLVGQQMGDVVVKANVLSDRVRLDAPKASGVYIIKVQTTSETISRKLYID